MPKIHMHYLKDGKRKFKALKVYEKYFKLAERSGQYLHICTAFVNLYLVTKKYYMQMDQFKENI